MHEKLQKLINEYQKDLEEKKTIERIQYEISQKSCNTKYKIVLEKTYSDIVLELSTANNLLEKFLEEQLNLVLNRIKKHEESLELFNKILNGFDKG